VEAPPEVIAALGCLIDWRIQLRGVAGLDPRLLAWAAAQRHPHARHPLAASRGHGQRRPVESAHPPTVLSDTPVTMTYAAAAARLGVSARTVRRRVASGELTKVGRRLSRASVEALAEGGRR
jgi:excisionase family DNA binding protein